jgi:thiopurine S-methyltransferase
MDAEFWHQRWMANQIGFHLDQVNPFLKRYWPELRLTPPAEVLVPLCGKTLDMRWLQRQGYPVTGVELSDKALQAFMEEHQIETQQVAHPRFCQWQGEGLRLFCGDFFDLSAEDVKGVKAVYDRAALVALPFEMRQRYIAHLRDILPFGVQILLITMEYDQSQMDGPPFSVPQAEVETLFKGVSQLKLLETVHSQRKGHALVEKVYHIIL